MGSAILFSYPELSANVGIQGTFTYAATSAVPLMAFVVLGPIIRKKLPEGFILTQWVRFRFGELAGAYISFLTVATMFLYMVAELSSLKSVIESLTSVNGLPAVIVQVVVTTIYTSLGGFKVSFVTDNIQGAMICALIVICTIAIGTKVEIQRDLIESSGLLKPSLLGYQLIYVLFVGIICADMFLSSFWMRVFASRTDKDLFIGISLATIVIFVILVLVSATGLIAVWSGIEEPGFMSFFLLMAELPNWVVGFVVVMVVALSTAVFDSLQSAMVSTFSTDLFRNKIPLLPIRILVVLVIIPVVTLALKKPSILQIFLISNLCATASIPVLFLGLMDTFYFLRGIDVVIGGLGGLLSVWFFGLVYYHGGAWTAGQLILMQTLYAEDWSVFGAFVAAPVGGWIFLALAVIGRIGGTWVYCKVTGEVFDCFEREIKVEMVVVETSENEQEKQEANKVKV